MYSRYIAEEIHLNAENGDDHPDRQADFVIVSNRKIFSVNTDGFVKEHHRYCAYGSGSDFAYGYLHAAYDLELDAATLAAQAVACAAAFDPFTIGPALILAD
jgi:ATP-dependent protease HslVU (ClpYQ) peptidase subunit